MTNYGLRVVVIRGVCPSNFGEAYFGPSPCDLQTLVVIPSERPPTMSQEAAARRG